MDLKTGLLIELSRDLCAVPESCTELERDRQPAVHASQPPLGRSGLGFLPAFHIGLEICEACRWVDLGVA